MVSINCLFQNMRSDASRSVWEHHHFCCSEKSGLVNFHKLCIVRLFSFYFTLVSFECFYKRQSVADTAILSYPLDFFLSTTKNGCFNKNTPTPTCLCQLLVHVKECHFFIFDCFSLLFFQISCEFWNELEIFSLSFLQTLVHQLIPLCQGGKKRKGAQLKQQNVNATEWAKQTTWAEWMHDATGECSARVCVCVSRIALHICFENPPSQISYSGSAGIAMSCVYVCGMRKS